MSFSAQLQEGSVATGPLLRTRSSTWTWQGLFGGHEPKPDLFVAIYGIYKYRSAHVRSVTLPVGGCLVVGDGKEKTHLLDESTGLQRVCESPG